MNSLFFSGAAKIESEKNMIEKNNFNFIAMIPCLFFCKFANCLILSKTKLDYAKFINTTASSIQQT